MSTKAPKNGTSGDTNGADGGDAGEAKLFNHKDVKALECKNEAKGGDVGPRGNDGWGGLNLCRYGYSWNEKSTNFDYDNVKDKAREFLEAKWWDVYQNAGRDNSIVNQHKATIMFRVVDNYKNSVDAQESNLFINAQKGSVQFPAPASFKFQGVSSSYLTWSGDIKSAIWWTDEWRARVTIRGVNIVCYATNAITNGVCYPFDVEKTQ